MPSRTGLTNILALCTGIALVAWGPSLLAQENEHLIVRGGVLVEAGTVDEMTPVGTGGDSARSPGRGMTMIDFDDVVQPCVFIDTVRLTNEYAAFGAVFEGPGGNDGGAVLDECGVFGVTGHSSPNFLAFNVGLTLSDGGIPRGPETIHFSPAVSDVSAIVGSGLEDGTVLMEAYNAAGALVDNATVPLSSAMQPISVSAAGIVRVVVSTTGAWLVLDDLIFDGGGAVSCDDVVNFMGFCNLPALPGQVLGAIVFADNTHDGETATIEVDGVPHTVPIGDMMSGVALYFEPATPGVHSVAFTNPDCCLQRQIFKSVNCP